MDWNLQSVSTRQWPNLSWWLRESPTAANHTYWQPRLNKRSESTTHVKAPQTPKPLTVSSTVSCLVLCLQKQVRDRTPVARKGADRSHTKRNGLWISWTITWLSNTMNTNKKQAHNHLIKMKLYKEIGMPPLPVRDNKRSETSEPKQMTTQDRTDQEKSEG